MAEDTIQAKRYSQAVFELAQERNEYDVWQNDLRQLVILAQNPEFVAVMENPKFLFEDKSRLLKSQLPGISRLAMNLALILTSQGNFSIISDIFADFQQLLDNYRGIEQAEVTTAVPLSEEEKITLSDRLGSVIGKRIILTAKVDPGIIGGIIVRAGGQIIDGSTRSQLAALKSELISAGI